MYRNHRLNAVTAFALCSLVILSGCVGVFSGSSTDTHVSSIETQTTQDTQTITTLRTETEITSQTSPTESSTVPTTPSPTSEDATTDNSANRSRYVEEFLSYNNDNTAELMSVAERGNTLYVNYSQSNITNLRSFLGPLRNYVVDYVSVVDGVYRDNSSDWDVERMVVHVKHENGTLAARYYVHDYWVAMRESHETIESVNVAAYAFNTMTLYSPSERNWVSRDIYMSQFRDRVQSSLDVANITLTRRGRTVFVWLHSDAGTQEELHDQFEQLLQEYAELHEFYYNPQEETYDTTFLSQPFVLDVAVTWEEHGHYYWGRISGHGAHAYTSGEYDMDGYLENFLDSGAYERGRLRNQP